MICTILLFDPNLRFCKRCGLCIEAIFADIKNGLTLEYQLFFKAGFSMKLLQCALRILFGNFGAILFFDPQWRFRKGYRLRMEALFANIQNALIFRILGVFESAFCIE